MIEITGTLSNPMNQAMANTTIRVEALASNVEAFTPNGALKGMTATATTNGSGNYTFLLLEGSYRIEVFQAEEFIIAGEALVDVNTPTPLTLTELLTTYAIPVV
jgi:hypothetical protein